MKEYNLEKYLNTKIHNKICSILFDELVKSKKHPIFGNLKINVANSKKVKLKDAILFGYIDSIIKKNDFILERYNEIFNQVFDKKYIKVSKNKGILKTFKDFLKI